jgi:hypothetical protein
VSAVVGPIQDRVSDGGISDMAVPVFFGELTSDKRRTDAVTIFDDFEKVSPFDVAGRRYGKSLPGPRLNS